MRMKLFTNARRISLGVLFCAIFIVLVGGCPLLFAPPAMSAPTLEVGNRSLVVFWTGPSALWNAANSNADNGLSEYHLRYREEGRGSWKEITEGLPITGVLSHTITGLTNGVSYEVQARAVNATGTGEWSASSAALSPAAVPDAPTALTLEEKNRKLIATWMKPIYDGDRPITGYELQYRTSGGVWPDDSLSISADTTSHTITELTNGTEYDVQVRAVNAEGAGSWSSVTTLSPATVPDAPTALTLELQNKKLAAAWTIPDYDGDRPITGYTLRYSDDSGTTWKEITSDNGTATSYTITGLANQTSYDVQVRAVNSQGESDWSASDTETPRLYATHTPAGTAELVNLSPEIEARIVDESLTVSLATATIPVAGVTVSYPTVNANGVITVVANTTAGTYIVSGTAGGTEQFSEYFFVTVTPPQGSDGGKSGLKVRVTAGISNWGDTADLNYIITSEVTNMSNIFTDVSTFNGDISDWDVRSVTNMGVMFKNAYAFNGDISDWDVSSVTNMFDMFSSARAFNNDISGWDVSSVTNMQTMFASPNTPIGIFNVDISDWNVSSLQDMSGMFGYSRNFNQDLDAWKDHWTLEDGKYKVPDGTFDSMGNPNLVEIIDGNMFLGSGVVTNTDGSDMNTPQGVSAPSWYTP